MLPLPHSSPRVRSKEPVSAIIQFREGPSCSGPLSQGVRALLGVAVARRKGAGNVIVPTRIKRINLTAQ